MKASKDDVFSGEKTSDGFYEITPSSSGNFPSKARVIDVREPSEFSGDLGHLEQAELVPQATVAQIAATWERSTPLVVVCRSGRRSQMAAVMLVTMGFTQVANLVGGMVAVRAALH